MTNTFKNINFGFASARVERDEAPELILNGSLDYNGIFEDIEDGPAFLFLGYKGSGKSFLGEKIDLMFKERYDRFVNLVDLKDFPFTPFSKIIKGDSEPESKYPDAWSWILLTYLFSSLKKDESVQHPFPERFQSTIDVLSTAGFLPNTDLKKMIRDSAKRNFKINIPKILEFSSDGAPSSGVTDITNFVGHMKEILKDIRSLGKHFVIIDGLDDILTERSVQYKSLGALMYETAELNSLFRRNNVPVKFIVLCRTDLYARVSGSNKNKVRQDLAVELDWYHDTENLLETALVQIANLRASLYIKDVGDIFSKFFPPEIDKDNTIHFLLEHTRHTPRDFLQLLKYIQTFYLGGIFSRSQIVNGCRQYSLKYFRTEIYDELDGYFQPTVVNAVFEGFGHLQKREFTLLELVEATELKIETKTNDIKLVLEAMFECSAIGNVQNRPGGKTFFSFKFRNRNATFHQHSRIVLHRGLWKSLNLI